MNTPETSESSWPAQSLSSGQLISLGANNHHPGAPVISLPSHQHYYSKVPSISVLPEEEEVENFYMDLEQIPEEMDEDNIEDDILPPMSTAPHHTTIDSDCTTFMEGRIHGNRPVTSGTDVKARTGRRTALARKLKKVGKHIHQIGHQKLQLKTLAHL